MSRIKKLESHYQKQLKDYKIKNISEFIKSIVDADITKGKYARFLIDAFLNNKFLEEDLIGGLNSSVGQAVSLFDKHKGKLPIEQRSVYALDKGTKLSLYQSPGDLWSVVKQFQGELSGKELKKEEQDKAYSETEFIYKDEETGFQIISPLSMFSAKWWGKGTRWCTSAEQGNAFLSYFLEAPLLILLMPNVNNIPNKNKLQLWKNGNHIQFMDEADKAVSLYYIEQNWNILEPLCRWLNNIQFIPINCITEDICKNIIKNNGKLLKNISSRFRTKELCKLAVQQDGRNLQYISEDLRNKELCELAVKNNGNSLQYIPKHIIKKELCELAVKQNGCALYHVPDELKTKELCKLAVKQNGLALKYIPKELRIPELCELAVKQEGWALKYIPKQLITKELCKLAMYNNSCAIKEVPKNLITKELCELAVKQNGSAIQHIPEEFRTKELYELIVKSNGLLLQHVPINFRTKELCEISVKNNGMSIQFIPQSLITKELCIQALMQNCNALTPLSYRQREICQFAKSLVKNMPILQTDIDKLDKKNDIQQKYEINMFQIRYEKIFQELRTHFPQKSLSLDLK